MLKHPYRALTAKAFLALLSKADCGVETLLKEHPELPSLNTLFHWRRRNPGFAKLWLLAQEEQAERLMQRCLDLAKDCTPQTAHVVRVRFDIYRHRASKVFPQIWGDKPQQTLTNVAVAVSISPERLNALRGKLERSRATLIESLEKKESTQKRREGLPQSLIDFDKSNRSVK